MIVDYRLSIIDYIVIINKTLSHETTWKRITKRYVFLWIVFWNRVF